MVKCTSVFTLASAEKTSIPLARMFFLLNAQQECNELAIAINKLQERDWIGGMTEEEHAKALENLHEEIADVLISIVNVLEIYKINKFDIHNAIEHKQTRQNQRIREFLKEY